MHGALAKYIRRLVGATRPYNEETEWRYHSPSALVEKCVDLGASPRATICWGRLVKVWALLLHRRSEVYPEDIQELARYVLPHRVWLGPHAASHGVTVDMVIDDIVNSVPVP
jgi:MoxR-like ATPase